MPRVVLGLEAQGEVSWEVPPGAPDGVLLFETNSAHLHKNSLTFLGGAQGWSLTFKVCLVNAELAPPPPCVCVCAGEG